uniref:Uncharacterized protein n=1 Tax=Mycena chlorophos TaxID=658473 RepID=A0ABQ0M1W2_MYCCL|nr:predicted protein [Mycena chlorophos]
MMAAAPMTKLPHNPVIHIHRSLFIHHVLSCIDTPHIHAHPPSRIDGLGGQTRVVGVAHSGQLLQRRRLEPRARLQSPPRRSQLADRTAPPRPAVECLQPDRRRSRRQARAGQAGGKETMNANGEKQSTCEGGELGRRIESTEWLNLL